MISQSRIEAMAKHYARSLNQELEYYREEIDYNQPYGSSGMQLSQRAKKLPATELELFATLLEELLNV